MSTATARAYQPRFAGRFVPFEMQKSPQNKAFYGQRSTYSGKAHCIKDRVLLDPCMGSGHILVYAFDVLMQIYESEGYSARDAAKLILEKNLYGIDIDDRAYQLSYFALMMKARQYDKRLFSHHVEPNICAVQESNGLHVREYEGERLSLLDLPRSVAEYLIEVFHDAKEYGSLLNVQDDQYDALSGYLEELKREGASNLLLQGWLNTISERMPALIKQAKIMSLKFDVVVTNPPYMGSSGMGGKLSEFVKDNYPDSKSDLFAVFIEKCSELLKPKGYQAMITQHAWMFLSSFEKLRGKLLRHDIVNMAHLGARAFEEIGGEVVQTTTFVLSKLAIADFNATFVRLVDYNSQNSKEEAFLSGKDRNAAQKKNFEKIPGCPVAYWASEKIAESFGNGKMKEYIHPKQGTSTGDDDTFVRLWTEVDFSLFSSNQPNLMSALSSKYRYFPLNKGGEYRKWYGNNDKVIRMDRHSFNLLLAMGNHLPSRELYFRAGITWSKITSATCSFRNDSEGFVFSSVGLKGFPKNSDKFYALGYLNSVLVEYYLNILSPGLSTVSGDIEKLPVIESQNSIKQVDLLVSNNVDVCKADWDSFETSWDFKRHPLVAYSYLTAEREVPAIGSSGGLESRVATYRSIDLAYDAWEHEAAERFNTLKANEEELNRIFIDIYGLQDELTPEIEDKDVTVRRADLGREIRSLISYAVGCMFGRYSLDVDGLAYAGGDWDASKYRSFIPDKDNILPVCDDEYFDDDITGRFVDFIRVVYGADTLEENLKFIAEALGGKGTPREVIRNYFLNDFYADHCKIYQKRPIYWMVESGKKNGFKALIYLHRYSRDLLAKLRTDYVHEQQERYRTQLSHILAALNTATGAERARLLKQQEKLTEQLKEITSFEEKVHHLADQNIEIDLDDGVKKNYELFADILAKI